MSEVISRTRRDNALILRNQEYMQSPQKIETPALWFDCANRHCPEGIYQQAGREYHETTARHPRSADICYPAMEKMRKAMDKYYDALAEIRERDGCWGMRG